MVDRRPVVSLAVDIGGTFTDAVLHQGDFVFTEKTLTTPGDLLEGFFACVTSVLAKARMAPGDVDGAIVHATTVVTNALIERKGARAAMIYTHGFSDILEIREERRFDIYDTQIQYPDPLIGAEASFALHERTLANGDIRQAPDRAEIERLVETLRASGVESVGVCFLHSYRNPANEQAVGRVFRELAPDIYLSLSSDVAPQIREYIRASTTAVNAYAIAITKPYLGRLKDRLVDDGFPAQPFIMLSSGGVVSPDTAGQFPVRMLESGPAAGALGASYIAKAMGEKEVLAFDMGGTTAKVCLIQDGEPLVTNMFEVDRKFRLKEGSGMPVTVPCIDLIEIGAGGGSIANIDIFGLLKVGPESAGAMPGPACYGRGGTKPTVTDAAVVLGLLDPNNFLGGEMVLDGAAARAALASIGDRVGLSVEMAAKGVYDIVCESMAGAVRAHAAERGVDVRGVPLLAFGGSGPVHACGVANVLNAARIIFPPHASVLSAFGSIITPVRFDIVRSALTGLDQLDWNAAEALLSAIEAEGRTALEKAAVVPGDMRFLYAVDVRYVGQHHELRIDLAERPRQAGGAAAIRTAFEAEYEKRHSIIQSEVPVEIVSWRVAATGGASTAEPRFGHAATSSLDRQRGRTVHAFGSAERSVPVVARSQLALGDRLEGPAIIEERETTIVIAPGWVATAEPFGCIVATRQPEG